MTTRFYPAAVQPHSGSFDISPTEVLHPLADAITDLPDRTEVARGIPSPWARPLLLVRVLADYPASPLAETLRDQWRGVLAVFLLCKSMSLLNNRVSLVWVPLSDSPIMTRLKELHPFPAAIGGERSGVMVLRYLYSDHATAKVLTHSIGAFAPGFGWYAGASSPILPDDGFVRAFLDSRTGCVSWRHMRDLVQQTRRTSYLAAALRRVSQQWLAAANQLWLPQEAQIEGPAQAAIWLQRELDKFMEELGPAQDELTFDSPSLARTPASVQPFFRNLCPISNRGAAGTPAQGIGSVTL